MGPGAQQKLREEPMQVAEVLHDYMNWYVPVQSTAVRPTDCR